MFKAFAEKIFHILDRNLRVKELERQLDRQNETIDLLNDDLDREIANGNELARKIMVLSHRLEVDRSDEEGDDIIVKH